MAIPNYQEFVEPILRHLAKAEAPVAASEVCRCVADDIGLTDEERRRTLASGKLIYRDRVSWGFNWLKRAGLAEAVTPGQWQLTSKGREIAAAHSSLPANLRASLDAKVKTRSGSSAPPSLIPPSGDKKAYRLPAQPIASGGQGDVYQAVRKTDGATVVFKRIRGKLNGPRMRREIEVQSSLKHAHIMPIIDWDAAYSWYVMPKGVRVMADLPRPVMHELICRIAASVVAALDFANASGHPHRDVKPQNIIELAGEGGETRWVLADWGLTRRALGETTTPLTKMGRLLGSEGFASPEAYRDPHNVGLPGDLYSLGQVIAWATNVEPVPNISPSVLPPWDRVVEKLTQQQIDRRPRTIAEVQELLSQVCAAHT